MTKYRYEPSGSDHDLTDHGAQLLGQFLSEFFDLLDRNGLYVEEDSEQGGCALGSDEYFLIWKDKDKIELLTIHYHAAGVFYADD